ncbi:tetratricopeptide repeat protein [candidate division WOR-3 bacterium]|nr:tetratricopeptide repeat protein [candidate division WOR-3 bacterium]
MKRNKLIIIIAAVLAIAVVSFADDIEEAYEYLMTGQYGKAIAPFERALSSAPNKTEIYYNLGVCYEKTGNYEKALQNYRNAGSTRDAISKVGQMERKIEDRKISRLRREAQSAYDAMNYGAAQAKAEEILDIEPSNSWARSFISKISDRLDLPADTVSTADTADTALQTDTLLAETTAAGLADTITEDTLASDRLREPRALPLWLAITLIGAVLMISLIAGFIIGRTGKKETVERAMKTLLKLLPAGMISVRKDEKLSLVFFEKGKVIKAIVEETDGVKIGGRSVAEDFLGTSFEYEDKPEGPWSEFADLMIDVYRHAQVEAGKSKFSSSGKKKPGKTSRRRKKK